MNRNFESDTFEDEIMQALSAEVKDAPLLSDDLIAKTLSRIQTEETPAPLPVKKTQKTPVFRRRLITGLATAACFVLIGGAVFNFMKQNPAKDSSSSETATTLTDNSFQLSETAKGEANAEFSEDFAPSTDASTNLGSGNHLSSTLPGTADSAGETDIMDDSTPTDESTTEETEQTGNPVGDNSGFDFSEYFTQNSSKEIIEIIEYYPESATYSGKDIAGKLTELSHEYRDFLNSETSFSYDCEIPDSFDRHLLLATEGYIYSIYVYEKEEKIITYQEDLSGYEDAYITIFER